MRKYSHAMIICSLMAILSLALARTLVSAAPPAATPVGSAFTYQGQLVDGDGNPITATCDFQFSLYDALTSGTQIGSTQTLTGVSVANGYFTSSPDFGAGRFSGDARWLEIAVMCPASDGGYTTLSPRQLLTAVPYAQFSLNSGSADLLDGKHASAFWNLAGNAGTNPTTNYLGTSDSHALELRVNGQRALRLEPSPGTPNLIGGYSGNSVISGVEGATISGGGYYNGTSYPNLVTDSLGTIGGGLANIAGNSSGTVNDAPDATVAGGLSNTASGDTATVSGGSTNTASGSYATVSGGSHNTAGGSNATVAGGSGNVATGSHSFAAGSGAFATQDGSFVWSDASGPNYTPYSYPDPGGILNSINVRATGGFYFATAINPSTGRPTAGMWVGGGGSGWNTYSDPSFKENLGPVASQEILARLAAVPIASWNYKSQDSSIQHIGPMAPDFNAAFGVGEPDKTGDLKYINSLDADGVALASIQALYQRSQEQASQIQALQDQLAKVERSRGSNPAGSLPVIWIAISGFLGMLVVLQAVMFFTLRHRPGRNGDQA